MNARPRSVGLAASRVLRVSSALAICASVWSCSAPRRVAPLATPEQVRAAADLVPEETPLVPRSALDAAYPRPSPTVVGEERGVIAQQPAQEVVAREPGQGEASSVPPAGAAPVTETPAKPETAKALPPASPLSGYVSSRYRLRWSPTQSDQDIYELASVDYVNAATPWFSAHVMGGAAADIDGQRTSPSEFYSLEDTYDESVVAKLYHAYVDFTPKDTIARARVGRQLDYLTPEVAYFDGVNLTSLPFGSSATAAGVYGGIPVHQYESSSSGDSLVGAYAETHPWSGGRARLDWMHYHDDGTFGAQANDLFGIGLWHASPSGWSADAQYTRLEEENRDVRVRAQYASPDGRSSARVSLYQLLETQFQRVLDLDPFSNALQEYFPFTQTSVMGTQAITDHTTLDGGVDLRRVQDGDDVSENNRDWERYYVTAHVSEFLLAGLTASFTIDYWTGDERDIDTWGADFSRDFGKAWKGSVGSYYSLYKYDLNAESERDDVRTYYARTQWKQSDAISFDLSYDFEDDDYDQYQTLRMGMLWRF